MIPPRAVFTIMAVGFILANCALPIMSFVDGAEISFTRIEIASAPAVEHSDSLERCERWSVSETRSTRFRMDCGWQIYSTSFLV
jgi:hypothetical protein